MKSREEWKKIASKKINLIKHLRIELKRKLGNSFIQCLKYILTILYTSGIRVCVFFSLYFNIYRMLTNANWHFSFYFSLFFFLLFSSFRCSQLNDSTTFFYVRLYEFCLWHSFEAVTLRKMLLCFVALSPFEMAIVKRVRKKTKK